MTDTKETRDEINERRRARQRRFSIERRNGKGDDAATRHAKAFEFYVEHWVTSRWEYDPGWMFSKGELFPTVEKDGSYTIPHPDEISDAEITRAALIGLDKRRIEYGFETSVEALAFAMEEVCPEPAEIVSTVYANSDDQLEEEPRLRWWLLPYDGEAPAEILRLRERMRAAIAAITTRTLPEQFATDEAKEVLYALARSLDSRGHFMPPMYKDVGKAMFYDLGSWHIHDGSLYCHVPEEEREYFSGKAQERRALAARIDLSEPANLVELTLALRAVWEEPEAGYIEPSDWD